MKVIRFNRRDQAIICQNENGPCPLLAVANCLLLQELMTISPDRDMIMAEELQNLVTATAIDRCENSSDPNVQRLCEDVLTILPSLVNGLDLNVHFDSISHFEFTAELSVFDSLGIALYHGWLYDRDNEEVVKTIGDLSYNHLMDEIVKGKSVCGSVGEEGGAGDEGGTMKGEGSDGEAEQKMMMKRSEVISKFLDDTASQLTYAGLLQLYSVMKDKEIAVFFRNNHFSTIYCIDGQLFSLVTDQGKYA